MQIEFFENVHCRLIMGGDDQVHAICILYSNKIKYPISDGSGPKKTSSGRARALNVGLGPGPSLSPSLKAGPRAGPGGLAGLSI